MLPTSCGELFPFRQHPEALMRRQTRPFTVEIKNSRKPASIRKRVPTLADRPRTDPTPVPAQSFAPLRFAPQGPEGEAVALEQPQTGKRGEETRQARILPDLLSPSHTGGLLSPETEKHSARRRKPQRPKPQERVEVQPERSPGGDHVALLDSDHERREPAEVESPAMPDMPDMVAVQQGAIPLSPSPEVRSTEQGRRSREVGPGWAYRAACRKAKRRGEPLPLRAGARWRRS